jgi:hypothetical protein
MVIDKLTEGQFEEVIMTLKRLPPMAPASGRTGGIMHIEADPLCYNNEAILWNHFMMLAQSLLLKLDRRLYRMALCTVCFRPSTSK